MIPMRTQSIFRSRWLALLWAGGIIWSAVDFVGSRGDSANSSDNAASVDGPAEAQQVAAALNSLGQ